VRADRTEIADAGTLAQLLEQAGAELTVAGLREILAGVIAAPRAVDPEAWTELAIPGAPDRLRARLAAIADAMREGADYGLADSPAPAARLDALRAELGGRGIDGFLVPLADEHQNEFPPLRARRLAWLSGFQGSAGLAVVLAERAAIFVDGRYTLQVKEQVDPARFAPCHLTDQPPSDWIADNLAAAGRLGYDRSRRWSPTNLAMPGEIRWKSATRWRKR